jgi:hypothetical protein
VLVLVTVGRQSSGARFYDKQAEEQALQAARKDPFAGDSDTVSVDSVEERGECPPAPSPQAGPCLDVTVTAKVPARDLSGNLDPSGLSVRASFDFFVWLEKRHNGHWKVTHTTYRPKGRGAGTRAAQRVTQREPPTGSTTDLGRTVPDTDSWAFSRGSLLWACDQGSGQVLGRAGRVTV